MTWDFQTLFRLHAPAMTRALRRRGASAETAEDLTQDAFLRALKSGAAEAGGGRDPKAYLFQISRNLLVDHRRREIRAPLRHLDEGAFAALPDPSPLTEQQLYDRQRLARTEAALAELPPRTRRAFELHRLDGLTLAETAQAMGLSTTRVWTLVRDAYRHLRERLRES